MALKAAISVWIAVLLFSTIALACFGAAEAQSSIPKVPKTEESGVSIPEFTIKYLDGSYDIPSSTSTDPFTGQPVTNPGQHVQNESLQITIKNPTVRPTGYLYYEVHMKGYFSTEWRNISHVEADYDSEFTTLLYALEGNNAQGHFGARLKMSSFNGVADFQVQAQIWVNEQSDDIFGTWVMVPYVSTAWSDTQRVSFDNGSVSISTLPSETAAFPSTSPSTVLTLSSTTPVPTQSGANSNVFQLSWLESALIFLGVVVALLFVVVAILSRKIRVLERKLAA
jgi:hypothetical protein